jgi:murein L,D-transpeptidase YcbB/YkuD
MIDWSAVTARNFPYQLRQKPGPNNALGEVKFLFPNPYSVCMHDTPSRNLFERSQRTFSSGCVRLARATNLAKLVLGEMDGWDAARVDEVLKSGLERKIPLDKHIPIHIVYWTAVPQQDGSVRYLHDVYGKDAPLAAAPKSARPPKT